jgi:RNA:NAD 2'-phosphotransferase (TPT1/KptA family)
LAEKQTIFDEKQVSLSVFASKILRHNPYHFDITLDENDFCSLSEFIDVINKHFRFPITEEEIVYVLQNSMWYDNPRFEIKDSKVRATYKHTYVRR